jgi:hypothetical protein
VVAVVVSMFPHNPFDFYANCFQHGPEVITTRFATRVGKALSFDGTNSLSSKYEMHSTAL